MEYKIEDYILERFNIYRNRVDDSVASKQVDKLDLFFLGKFDNTYALYRNRELDRWTPYLIIEIHPHDFHNGVIICQHLGRNFTKNNHQDFHFRRGEFLSVSEEFLMEKYNWYKINEGLYIDKYLYIFQNELGRIKIGQAKNVQQRNQNIKIQAGISIEILNLIPAAAKYEMILHQIFKNKRYAGEWFNLSSYEITWLTSLNSENIEQKITTYKKYHS